jgi:hypothetical protein
MQQLQSLWRNLYDQIEAPKLLFTSPIEKYLDQIGDWLVMTTTRCVDRGWPTAVRARLRTVRRYVSAGHRRSKATPGS